jgi:hypothetical protein
VQELGKKEDMDLEGGAVSRKANLAGQFFTPIFVQVPCAWP